MNEWALWAGLSCLILPVCLLIKVVFSFLPDQLGLSILGWPYFLMWWFFRSEAVRSKTHHLAWFLSALCGFFCSIGLDWTSSEVVFRSDSTQGKCTGTFISFYLHHICWCHTDKRRQRPSPKPIAQSQICKVMGRSESPWDVTVTIWHTY